MVNKTKTYIKNVAKAIIQRPSFNTLFYCLSDFHLWKKYLEPPHNSLYDQMPWISFSAIHFIKRNIKKNHIVFEAGSGGSTLFWANNVKEVIAIEHDEQWYNAVLKIIDAKKMYNIHYELIKAQVDMDFQDKSISSPKDYISDGEGFTNMCFKNYATFIDGFADEYFDFVLIDGRARPSCLYHALPKVKSGGYLILDNSERSYYLQELSELKDKNKWERKDFLGPVPYIYHFSCTTFFRKK